MRESTDSARAGRLAGKVALVTGAGTQGEGWSIGAATAVRCAREGARVACLDRDADAAAATTAHIEAAGGTALAVPADVTDATAVADAVARVVAAWERLDVLVNNVGILSLGGPVEASEADWDRVMDVNLKSMFLTCKHAVPVMRRLGAGAIVNVASIGGIRWTGIPYAAYATSKAGVLQFTRSVALQHAREGIRANSVLPGLMDTPMVRAPLRDHYGEGGVETMIARRNAQCPTGRMGDAWDVAHACVFLASDEAKYITATELVVDGGISAAIPGSL
jgi:NAD(P)-dependent dehydrogenase (short-subunit alcohol dehydrogenase family)